MSPTYDRYSDFDRDFSKLSSTQQRAFMKAVLALVTDLRRGQGFRKGLRIKRVQGVRESQVYEMTWAPDGRATWEYGSEQRDGEPHVIWRRVGSHAIFNNP